MDSMLILSTILITLALVCYSTGIWAERIARRGLESWIRKFHRYSLFVWLIWLVPYFGGMYLAMSH